MYPERLSTAKLAAFLGITVQRAHQLENEGTLQKGDDKKYDLRDAVQAYTKRLREQASGRMGMATDGEVALDPIQEKARLTKYQADLAEIQLQKVRQEVVSTEEILEVWQRVISAARARIMSLTTRLPNMIQHLNKKDISIIEEEIRDILERLTTDGDDSLDEVSENALNEGSDSKNAD